MNEVTLIARIPNGKADINNQGAFSTDYIGKSWGYPDGDYATRARIWQDHVDYVKGFSIFWPTTLAFQPRCKKRSTPGDWPRTNSSTQSTGRINCISARRAA